MTSGKLLVVGSLNQDTSLKVHVLPKPGETVAAIDVLVSAGGKSANQAVAASRLGAEVSLIGAVGDDEAGTALRRQLEASGVDTSSVSTIVSTATGTALITVDDQGENTIVVAAGANDHLTPERIGDSDFGGAAIISLCLEVPDHVLVYAALRAKRQGARVMLNASPLRAFDCALLELADIVVVNEHEYSALFGELPAEDDDWLTKLAELATQLLIVTLGKDGAIAVDRSTPTPTIHRQESRHVEAVDTTGCGDALAGVLAGELSKGTPLPEALERATAFASLVATRSGAQSSYPSREAFAQWQAEQAYAYE
ncbi:ribokinase [Leifsonia shinshuensis]|uniref:Ribokinase n=1 Tax=Leifsonia shinshuensis TaxID=150026 RepID=A0A853CTC8_9MICO|nr:ribokinase [Leifsonia shinshuensis]NYJ22711.1 ribokinase [Leifsonia shinshuensis]